MTDKSDPVAKLVAEILEELRMSQTRIADDLGIHRTTLSRWASGNRLPRPEVVRALLAAIETYADGLRGHVTEWDERLGRMEGTPTYTNASRQWRAGSERHALMTFERSQVTADGPIMTIPRIPGMGKVKGRRGRKKRT